MVIAGMTFFQIPITEVLLKGSPRPSFYLQLRQRGQQPLETHALEKHVQHLIAIQRLRGPLIVLASLLVSSASAICCSDHLA